MMHQHYIKIIGTIFVLQSIIKVLKKFIQDAMDMVF